MSALDMHPADEAERIAAFRNVHDVWGRGLSVDEHLQRRLSSVQHNRARWFVGCVDGLVVASLGGYPLKFSIRGTVVDGIAIGAVHTLAEYRGRGFAPQLLRFVEDFAAERGAQISMLYSDIACGYYARLGYVECPSRQVNLDLNTLSTDVDSDTSMVLTRCQPEESRPACRELYESTHASLPLFIHRDAEYWQYLQGKGTEDRLYLVKDRQGKSTGYLRARVDDGGFFIRDAALPQWHGKFLGQFLLSAAAEAHRAGVNRITGWVPSLPNEPAIPTTHPRETEITMLKSLKDGVAIDREIVQAADFFHEIDHV